MAHRRSVAAPGATSAEASHAGLASRDRLLRRGSRRSDARGGRTGSHGPDFGGRVCAQLSGLVRHERLVPPTPLVLERSAMDETTRGLHRLWAIVSLLVMRILRTG